MPKTADPCRVDPAPLKTAKGAKDLSVAFAERESAEIMGQFGVSPRGLSQKEVRRRLKTYGPNEAVLEKRVSWIGKFFSYFKDPLLLLLIGLGLISHFTGDSKAAAIIGVMLGLSVFLRFYQERRADFAATKLKALVRTTATVIREGKRHEVPLHDLVPGDIVALSAGDLVPADLRLIESRDLFINQATLTGESLPVEKHAEPDVTPNTTAFERQCLAFMGTNIASGTATALVLTTGKATKFGELARDLRGRAELSSFDLGTQRFTWLMLKFMLVMVPAVFLINGLSKGDWLQAFLFAVAVAVGLTPELLPMIVTVNLSKAALDMSRKKAIVKRLNAIQDFGAMDILCTDKTGTLTEGKVALIRHVDLEGHDSARVFNLAYLNSRFQTGLKNLMDAAVLQHDKIEARKFEDKYRKVDEIPFDFKRRSMSVVVEGEGKHILICKGAVEEVLARCSQVEEKIGSKTKVSSSHHLNVDKLVRELSAEGFRLIALAYREIVETKRRYSQADEADMTLVGFLAFLDPPKVSAGQALRELDTYGVAVKILTGDNEIVTRKICGEVGLEIKGILKGSEIDEMDDAELARRVEQANVFDKLEPAQKRRVICALRSNGHVVGYLGDGINDAPALEAADVGISVEGAVDIAKESSDIILLEKSLTILRDGVLEGRRAFGNIVKYIKMTASSNFGNMASVVGASVFLPFLPMLPLQVVVLNLMYDISQTSIPTDGVDDEYLRAPRRWRIDEIKRFVLAIGPMSSIFDYATYFLMLYVFNAWTNPALFHTGWFVESLLTQTLIIHIIRTRKIPFIQSRASWPLTLTTLAIVAIGIWLPFSGVGADLGFVPLPLYYWFYIAAFLAAYFMLTQLMKNWFVKRYGWE